MNDGAQDARPAADGDAAAGAQALAEAVAQSMFAADRATQALGMRVARVAPGFAVLTMTVRADMLNGHATCHGGLIFTLADSAFAFACNSYDARTVASGCGIDFMAPAREHDVLTATSRERSLSGRTGVYDVEVTNQLGVTVALFRGKSYRVTGKVVGVGAGDGAANTAAGAAGEGRR